MSRKPFISLLFLLLLTAGSLCLGSEALDVIEAIPVQEGGRVRPFLSFANEVTLFITGEHRFQGQSPAATIIEWIAMPEESAKKPIIPAAYEALRKELGESAAQGRISPEHVLGNRPFLREVERAAVKKRSKETLTALEEKRLEVHEKALLFQAIAHGLTPGVIANPKSPSEPWMPFHYFGSDEGIHVLSQYYPAAEVKKVGAAFLAILDAVRAGGAESMDFEAAERFSVALKDLAISGDVALDYSLVETEVFYLRLRPFHNAWILYLSAVLFSLPILFRSKGAAVPLWRKGAALLSIILFFAGFAIHGYGMYLRCVIAGRPPVSNMYESIIWVSWVVVLFSTIYYLIWRSLYVRNVAALVAAFILILAEKFPVVFNPSISPLVPVLRSNLWLTVHVLTITMSYGALALAWGLGHGIVFDYTLCRGNREKNKQNIKYLYLTLLIGVVLLAAGTILGGVWANYSWGRFWGWDPKETWALIALLGYLAVLHGRYAGWLGDFGIAVGSVVAFLGVVVAWYGVNYVLSAGLHSYGFGGGGSIYVLLAALLDLAFIGILGWRYKRSSTPAGST